MSYWTYISGVITVVPMGRTQPEKRYILDTVLEHLPKVTGSEVNMNTYVLQEKGMNGSCNYNEFFEWAGNDELHPIQDNYMIILEGSLRDRMFEETLRELNSFLNRLAKRVMVDDILVKLKGSDRSIVISNPKPYREMEEGPSWFNGEIAWAEYLMWERAEDSVYPKKLVQKYCSEKED